DSKEHLDLLDGLLEEVLESKWRAFGRRRWIESLCAFTVYYVFYFVAFMSRPLEDNRDLSGDNTTSVSEKSGFIVKVSNKFADVFSSWADNSWMSKDSCHLWQYRAYGVEGYIRMVCELMVSIMVLAQLFLEIRDIRNIGRKRWWQVLKSFPAKILYKISLLFTLFVIPLRFMCGISPDFLVLDNSFSLLAVLMTTVHFLFYCRAVKFVGPFVLMVYTIITRDMIRFFLIYFIFLLGFSQGFYVIFLACQREADSLYGPHHPNRTNILDHPAESMLRLFITTIGEFTVFYRELNNCAAKEMAVLGKILFVIFEMFVSLMQFNLLIAMMTRTYELIYRTQKEWKRQWAQVILMLELSLQPAERLMALLKYSRPIGTDKRRRAFVVNRKFNAMNETERILKETMENEKRLEKKQLLKRRLKGFTKEKGERSSSSAGHMNFQTLTSLLAPTPMPGHSREDA
uniref:Ion_trans domain-containing protein n=4 Tax=Bursaphelenchus xylophilus TaxID=6326 RepID=A0A1I7SHT8_BURXY